MSRIRSKDTKPEVAIRRLVHSLSYRYRLHVRGLPGCPDLVFPGRRKVIWVHGCFWHRHACPKGRSLPTTNRAFWIAKFRATQRRDRKHKQRLRARGWAALTVWECQVERWPREKLAAKIRRFLERREGPSVRRSE